MVLMFGAHAVEAVGELLHKRNSPVPVFHRLGKRLERGGLVLLFVYLVVMVALLVALIDRVHRAARQIDVIAQRPGGMWSRGRSAGESSQTTGGVESSKRRLRPGRSWSRL